MAEDKFNANIKSPRFSTTKALGFRGGSQNAQSGNLQPPSFVETAGVNPPPATTTPPGDSGAGAGSPSISQFSVPSASVPRPTGIGTTLALAGGSALAGEAAKGIGKSITGALKKTPETPETDQWDFASTYNAPPATTGFDYAPASSGDAPGFAAPLGNTGFDMAPASVGDAPGYAGASPSYTLSETGVSYATPNLTETGVGYFNSTPSTAYDAWDFGGSAADAAGSFGDVASSAADAWDFGGGGVDVTGVPIVGPLLRASQGDYGGAAGSAIGGAIGSAILPGIGTAIGSALGGFFGGDCFITEAVMSSGGADGGMELEALRGFRDNILSKTPQGQAMIAEYEAIAPVVVECVSQRQDGVQIFQQIKGQFIDPAVQAVQQGNYQEALQIYASMIAFVTPFAAEAAEAGMGGGDPDEMNAMGDHAAMVGNVPEYSGEAMPDGGMGGGYMPMMPSPAGAMPPMGGGNMMPQPPMQPQRPAIGQTFARRF